MSSAAEPLRLASWHIFMKSTKNEQ